MSLQYVDTPTKTFEANGAITKHTLVTLESAGTVATCGAGETPIGVAQETVADNSIVAVRLLNAGGTVSMTAGAATTIGSVVYANAAGKVSGTDSGSDVVAGIANEAATADGDYIEVIPKLV